MMFPAPLVALLVAFASVASVSGTHYVMKAAQNEKELEIYREGQRRVDLQQGVVDEYVKEVTNLRERKPRVVLYCSGVQANPSGSSPPGTGQVDSRDIGPQLREAAEELIRCNAARKAARVK